MSDDAAAWPPLPLADWSDTRDTLHMWTQIVGKTRLALAPMVNHWWQVPLYVSARGLTTSWMPYGTAGFSVEFDFIDHTLVVQRDDGRTWSMALAPRSVADFYQAYMAGLRSLGIDVRIWPVPVEIADGIPFANDETHASYDAAAAHNFWRALTQASRVLSIFRGRFIGKASPVHFFWGASTSRARASTARARRSIRAASPASPIGRRAKRTRTRASARDGGPALSAARSRRQRSTPTRIRSPSAVQPRRSDRLPGPTTT